MLAGIDLVRLFESSANTLLSKGDFEKAIQRFIMAKSDFVLVAKNFPDFIPLPLHVTFGINHVRLLNQFLTYFHSFPYLRQEN